MSDPAATGQRRADPRRGARRRAHAAEDDVLRTEAAQQTNIGTASDQYLRTVLTRALGNDKAAGLIDRILQGNDNSGIESLKWMDPGAVAEMIGNEHPQIIATILVHLEPDQAAEILRAMQRRCCL